MKATTFTRRTDWPKLGWLISQLQEDGIPCAITGSSSHAPILSVLEEHLDRAWEILGPVDDVPDDDPRYLGCDAIRVPEIVFSHRSDADAGLVHVVCDEMRYESACSRGKEDELAASLMTEWHELRKAGEI